MTGFSSLLCHPFTVSLVNVHGDGDDHVKGVVDMVSLGEPVLDEGGQVFLIPDQFVIIAQPYTTSMLFEQCCVVLDHLSPLL